MRVFVNGTVKKIKESGILIQSPEKEVFVLNHYDKYILDFSKLELRLGDSIEAIGMPLLISEFGISTFAPDYVSNEKPGKRTPTVFREFRLKL